MVMDAKNFHRLARISAIYNRLAMHPRGSQHQARLSRAHAAWQAARVGFRKSWMVC